MKYKVPHQTTAYIFSFAKIRRELNIATGVYTLTNQEVNSIGETIFYFENLPPLIVKTHYGLTPFGKLLEKIED